MQKEDKEYIVSFALINRNGKRAMPIGGKTTTNIQSESNEAQAKELILEILLRIIQSPSSEIIKDDTKNNIYCIWISEREMKTNLPNIKSQWIKDGNEKLLLANITNISRKIMTISYEKYIGINFSSINR